MELNRIKKFINIHFKSFYNSQLGLFFRTIIGVPIDLYKQKKAADYWRGVFNEYSKGNIPIPSITPNKTLKDELIIWQYWGQGIDNNLPPLVKLSFASIDKFKGNFKIIRLDDNLMLEYLNIPSTILDKVRNGIFTRAFFSDLLRLALLYYYGGVWIDSTIVITSPIVPSHLEKEYFVFQRSISTANKLKWFSYNRFYFNWNEFHRVRILSGYFCARKRSEEIYKLLSLFNYYVDTEEDIKHYFLIQILFNELKNNKKLNYIPTVMDDTYPNLLLLELQKEFDQEKYHQILSKSNIHVFRHNIPVLKNSFYEYVIRYIDDKFLQEFN